LLRKTYGEDRRLNEGISYGSVSDVTYMSDFVPSVLLQNTKGGLIHRR